MMQSRDILSSAKLWKIVINLKELYKLLTKRFKAIPYCYFTGKLWTKRQDENYAARNPILFSAAEQFDW